MARSSLTYIPGFSASLANRGKGYWKFNSQLLRDSNYIDIVKTCIRDTLSEYYSGGNIDDFLHVYLCSHTAKYNGTEKNNYIIIT